MSEVVNDNLLNRVSVLEQRLLQLEVEEADRREPVPPLWSFGVAVIALVCCQLAFGWPNHLFQLLLAAALWLVVILEREVPIRPHWSFWGTVLISVLATAMAFKLVIGGGDPQPLEWLRMPVFEGGLTKFKVTWEDTGLSNVSVPLTTIQAFLMVLVLLGVLIGFEIFSALIAVILAVLALPQLLSFDWNWVLPALLALGLSAYLQRGRPIKTVRGDGNG